MELAINKNAKLARSIMVMFLVLSLSLSGLLLPSNAFAKGVGGIDVTMENGNIVLEGEDGMFDGTSDDSWKTLFTRYKSIIAGISGIATLTMLGAFIFLLAKLGATSGDSKARSACITGILFTGLATAGLGSVTIIMAFFYNAFAELS